VFTVITFVAGQLLLPLVITNTSDCWLLAASLGLAVAGVVAAGSPSWVGSEKRSGQQSTDSPGQSLGQRRSCWR
jgi:hypothetical protein